MGRDRRGRSIARKTLIQVRRDTAANWTSANPTLSAGEVGYETDTGKFKIGDGSTAWISLTYSTTDALLTTSDITTNNASTSKHGFLKKLDNNAAHFMDGTGSWSTPSGTGSVASDTIWDAKGDLAVGTGADTASKLAVGTDAYVLTADSTQTTGLKWAAASGGAATDGWVDDTADTWTYASADSPTFTFTITGDRTAILTPGKRIKLTQTTVKYFIVTAVSVASGTTTVTIYGGTDYTLANAAISANYHSAGKAPDGFPLNPAKWTVEVTDTSERFQSSPTTSTWYNLGSVSISIPIGIWSIYYAVIAQGTRAAAGAVWVAATLSTANNSASDSGFTGQIFATGSFNSFLHVSREKVLALAAKTSYFLNTSSQEPSSTEIENRGDLTPTVIRAVCAYL